MDELICPLCAEAVGPDDEKCRSCGERLDGGEGEVRAGSSRTLISVLVFGFLFVAAVVCLIPMLMFTAVAPAPGPPPTIAFPPPPPSLPPDPGQAALPQVQALSLDTARTTTSMGGLTMVPCSVYSWGGFAMIDMGNVRIVVRGVSFGGFVGSEVTIKESVLSGGSGSSKASIGAHSFNTSRKKGVTVGNFDKLAFEIDDGQLTLTKSGVQVDLQGKLQVIVVDADGSNAKLLPYTGP